MAVFLINICKFNGCGIKFDSLGELITHIENIHIDYDPHVVEQKEQSQPACLPLSYVLRFITDAARKEGPFINNAPAASDLKRKLAIKHHSYSMSSSNRSTTPTGSEIDDEEMVVSESENSNDSWTTEEFSSEFIMRYGSRHSGTAGNTASNEKPFACPVPGCKKRYKNVNGIKYHSKNGHKKEGKVRKGFKCHCGKSYKTSQGLKNHSMLIHNTTSTEALNSIATTPQSPSSGSNSGSTFNHQLSPNERGTTTTTTTSASTPTPLANGLSAAAASAAVSVNNVANTIATTAQQQNQITLKAAVVASTQQQQQTPLTTANLIAVNSLAVSSPPPNSHALLSTHNPNKLVKLTNADCFDGVLGVVGTKATKNLFITSMANGTGNILVSATTAAATTATAAGIPNNNSNASSADDTNGNGAKINLPSLVNLNGILTPATSPKQHTQLTPQISPNQQQQHHHHHQPQQQQQHHHHQNNSNSSSNSNNENSLPLTPISPLNKTFNGTSAATNNNSSNNSNSNNNSSSNSSNADCRSSTLYLDGTRSVGNHNNNSNGSSNNNNNNNATSPNLNHHGLLANSITADGTMTEDT